MENDLTLVNGLLEAVEKMIQWDSDFHFKDEASFKMLIESSGGFDFLEQMKQHSNLEIVEMSEKIIFTYLTPQNVHPFSDGFQI